MKFKQSAVSQPPMNKIIIPTQDLLAKVTKKFPNSFDLVDLLTVEHITPRLLNALIDWAEKDKARQVARVQFIRDCFTINDNHLAKTFLNVQESSKTEHLRIILDFGIGDLVAGRPSVWQVALDEWKAQMVVHAMIRLCITLQTIYTQNQGWPKGAAKLFLVPIMEHLNTDPSGVEKLKTLLKRLDSMIGKASTVQNEALWDDETPYAVCPVADLVEDFNKNIEQKHHQKFPNLIAVLKPYEQSHEVLRFLAEEEKRAALEIKTAQDKKLAAAQEWGSLVNGLYPE